ncbi:unnamed protein product, partial [Meganyctiphanes norvegica]
RMSQAFVMLLVLDISYALPSSGIQPFNPVFGIVNTGPVPINPVAVQPNPVAVQPTPDAVQPTPVAGQATPVPGHANPVSSQANRPEAQVNNSSTRATQVLGRHITDFGLEMSDAILQNGEQDTVVFSPLSIATLLTLLMAGMGKQSKTYYETAELLGYNSNGNDEHLHQLYKQLLNDLSSKNDRISLKIGNQLFLQGDSNNSVQVLSSFTKTAKENYNAGIETLNFLSDPFGSTNRINEWVNTATEGKIPKLLSNPLNPHTKFMAVNTVYFKAPWESPFLTDATRMKSFDTGRGKIDMKFMTQIMDVKYHDLIVSDTLNATIIELPYKGTRYSMFIMKPKGPASLNSVVQLEEALTANNLNILLEATKSKQPIPVSVQIPRMRLKYRTSLKDTLKKMGATSMFSVINADFSRITSSNQPIMDDMIHEAVMDITEEGTEAVAASSTLGWKFGTNLVFELDQPSLLCIHDSKTKVPIFWVRLVTPESI